MATLLWLIRHGETDWNRDGLYQGQADIPLNATGLEQARETAGELGRIDVSFAAIYSSPLLRARQTAEVTAQRMGMGVREDKRLMEIHQGEWTGKDYRSVVVQFGDPLKADGIRDTVHDRAPGGESVAEVAERMRAAADDISSSHTDEQVLIFTHGLALATLYCQAKGIALEQVYRHIPQNGQVTVIEWE
jgi:broad specificity phosphatase PhoE